MSCFIVDAICCRMTRVSWVSLLLVLANSGLYAFRPVVQVHTEGMQGGRGVGRNVLQSPWNWLNS